MHDLSQQGSKQGGAWGAEKYLSLVWAGVASSGVCACARGAILFKYPKLSMALSNDGFQPPLGQMHTYISACIAHLGGRRLKNRL